MNYNVAATHPSNNSNFYIDITWSSLLLRVSERRVYPSATFKPLIIGSGEDVDIVIKSKLVSHHHARVIKSNSDFAIEDLGSKNGVFINGKIRHRPWIIYNLHEVFEIRPFIFDITLIPAPLRYTIYWQNGEKGKEDRVEGLKLPITIGRDSNNGLVLPDKKVSRHHADIKMEDHHLLLLDNKSYHGSPVNGIKSQQTILRPNDDIRIGPYIIHVSPFISESHKMTR